MSIRVIDVDNSQVVRARVDGATACFYPGNKNRVVVVADGGDFAAAERALAELTDHVEGPRMKEHVWLTCPETEDVEPWHGKAQTQ